VSHNLIVDVPGVRVGHAEAPAAATGVTAIVIDGRNVASAVTRGGAPGSRDTTLLEPHMTATGVDAVLFSGGSVFGLDAAGGALAYLRAQGRGVRVGAIEVPLAVQAIIFDLLNGGDKAWGRTPLYWELGWEATKGAAPAPFALGTAGAGYGATTAILKGGLGSASAVTAAGFVVGAIAVVNAVGSATIAGGPHFWAAPYEVGAEFGGFGLPTPLPRDALRTRLKGRAEPSTTIALVATDAVLTKAQAKRLAIMADDGLARALRPAHAPMDGDTVFAVATLRTPMREEVYDLTEIGLVAADCLARAIARGVFEARALPFPGALPSWRDRFAALSPKQAPAP
jgi:L-aminopeptidase/D-esterase-like protein